MVISFNAEVLAGLYGRGAYHPFDLIRPVAGKRPLASVTSQTPGRK